MLEIKGTQVIDYCLYRWSVGTRSCKYEIPQVREVLGTELHISEFMYGSPNLCCDIFGD